MTLNKDVNMAVIERKEEEIEGMKVEEEGGGALRPSTYGVCRKAAHKKIQAHIKIDRKVVRKRW